ncbi:hypothetical protein LTR91_026053 [Friedmanniomyces endolithicus]|uniref:Protein kinase domain-containing protein n=1 Tax=Friedmanniomyces endolithicus TaxID=329885 RepID=A0AAN6GYS4_9PEZI|nr:hypothetical protein LTR87_007626 [Friedmanniomyces endolithicus]KAK0906403.1 hypothetical protein LTR57_017773 [Friedmanniomyces endolithicus]KAK0949933.1 hypothetical protein LTR91_026053 [Friedmanniomyces endolithicus]KAK0968159.1 hypothetical protein LTS01_016831 [Friedmanniomyces endolithicus]KAK1031601.1 hypothetical protein LTS16_017923 [Friedmanniomyces endolithicus]
MQHNTLHEQADIKSRHDLTDLCEVEDIETGAVLRSTFTFVDVDDIVWFGQVCGVRKYDLTVEDLRQNLQRIPDDTIYPEVTPGLTLLADDNELDGLYIKRPKLLCLDDAEETRTIPRLLLEEARILESLKPNPHPNLVRYRGIVGIALEKHDIILQYRFEDDPRELDVAACIDGIRAGVAHLHSLGYAHNDLNPMNIALDKNDQPVILDFGSCRKFGDTLLSGGTPGWIDEDYSISSPLHDEVALEKIASWLRLRKSEWAAVANTDSAESSLSSESTLGEAKMAIA